MIQNRMVRKYFTSKIKASAGNMMIALSILIILSFISTTRISQQNNILSILSIASFVYLFYFILSLEIRIYYAIRKKIIR